MLKDKTVVIGISGGIAAYKACDVVSKLKTKCKYPCYNDKISNRIC